jgi:hypothetical protein
MPEKYRRPHTRERVQVVERMKLAWEAERDALATVRHFNAKLSAKGYSLCDNVARAKDRATEPGTLDVP